MLAWSNGIGRDDEEVDELFDVDGRVHHRHHHERRDPGQSGWTIEAIATGTEAGLDQPITLAFGIGGTELTLYVVNLAGVGIGPGPALVAIDVDTPGRPLP